MRSTASRRAWSCCLLWLLALAPAQAQQQQQQQQPVVVERVSDGQQLADAVAAYGRRNADTTLLVPASTTLRLANATLPIVPDAEAAGGKAFSSGVLIIEASEGRGVIDAGMRAGTGFVCGGDLAIHLHPTATCSSPARLGVLEQY